MLEWSEKIRVEWGDCDPAKIIFYPRYFAWVDAAGHHMLEHGGLHHDILTKKYGVRGLVLGHVGMDFKSPGFFGDTLDIVTKVTKIGGASFELGHEIHRGETLLLTGKELRIWAVEDPDHPAGISARPIPDDARAILAAE
ncbi:MAG: acyl-CoA thioesterase [Rhizobiales bacterium]|nr:acyl-CoA thioesterase [Hyphomicrobiales bacterium]